MKPRERLRSAGFTLLEVLAAVAVLGIVYVVVARGAIQGLQVEGDASRRLRASLLADRVLNDLEIALSAESAPPVGETESSEGDFNIAVEVAPLDVATLLADTSAQAEGRENATSELRLLQPSLRVSTPPVLSIAVRVSWIEGVSEQEVTRTSYAFDASGVAPLLEEISSGLGTTEQAPEDQGGAR